jgi:hypothetical protein
MADWMEHAKPLPNVPMEEFANTVTMRMIEEYPNLFKIVTPINIDHFEELLQTHPNRPFVESVCHSLHEGFWPWVDIRHSQLPSVVSALKSGLVPVFTLLEGRPGPGLVLLFQILYKNRTGPYRTGLYQFMSVRKPV